MPSERLPSVAGRSIEMEALSDRGSRTGNTRSDYRDLLRRSVRADTRGILLRSEAHLSALTCSPKVP